MPYIEKWTHPLDKGRKVGTVFMNLKRFTQSQFITCQSKCVWLFFQCDKIRSKLFFGTISKYNLSNYIRSLHLQLFWWQFIIFNWGQFQIRKNHIFLNPEKFHCLITNKDIANESTDLDKKNLHVEAEQKIITDKDLNFQSHSTSIIKTAIQKLTVLIRVAPFMTDFN